MKVVGALRKKMGLSKKANHPETKKNIIKPDNSDHEDRQSKLQKQSSILTNVDSVYDGTSETLRVSTKSFANFIFEGDLQSEEEDDHETSYWQGCQNIAQ